MLENGSHSGLAARSRQREAAGQLAVQVDYSVGGVRRASSSATLASRLSRRARVRASTTIWLSNSSRLTRSSLLKPLCSKALNWLSNSLRGSGVSPLNRRAAWPLRASRKALGASMGNVPESDGGQCITGSESIFPGGEPHVFRAFCQKTTHCFCAYCIRSNGRMMALSIQCTENAEISRAGKVSA